MNKGNKKEELPTLGSIDNLNYLQAFCDTWVSFNLNERVRNRGAHISWQLLAEGAMLQSHQLYVPLFGTFFLLFLSPNLPNFWHLLSPYCEVGCSGNMDYGREHTMLCCPDTATQSLS